MLFYLTFISQRMISLISLDLDGNGKQKWQQGTKIIILHCKGEGKQKVSRSFKSWPSHKEPKIKIAIKNNSLHWHFLFHCLTVTGRAEFLFLTDLQAEGDMIAGTIQLACASPQSTVQADRLLLTPPLQFSLSELWLIFQQWPRYLIVIFWTTSYWRNHLTDCGTAGWKIGSVHLARKFFIVFLFSYYCICSKHTCDLSITLHTLKVKALEVFLSHLYKQIFLHWCCYKQWGRVVFENCNAAVSSALTDTSLGVISSKSTTLSQKHPHIIFPFAVISLSLFFSSQRFSFSVYSLLSWTMRLSLSCLSPCGAV